MLRHPESSPIFRSYASRNATNVLVIEYASRNAFCCIKITLYAVSKKALCCFKKFSLLFQEMLLLFQKVLLMLFQGILFSLLFHRSCPLVRSLIVVSEMHDPTARSFFRAVPKITNRAERVAIMPSIPPHYSPTRRWSQETTIKSVSSGGAPKVIRNSISCRSLTCGYASAPPLSRV